jgi:hypothetical protein
MRSSEKLLHVPQGVTKEHLASVEKLVGAARSRIRYVANRDGSQQ